MEALLLSFVLTGIFYIIRITLDYEPLAIGWAVLVGVVSYIISKIIMFIKNND